MTTAARRPQQRTHRRAEAVRTHRQSYLSSQPQRLQGVQTVESHSWAVALLSSRCHSRLAVPLSRLVRATPAPDADWPVPQPRRPPPRGPTRLTYDSGRAQHRVQLFWHDAPSGRAGERAGGRACGVAGTGPDSGTGPARLCGGTE